VKFVQAEVLSMKELKDTLEQSSDQLSTRKQVLDQIPRLIDKYKQFSHQPVKTAEIIDKFVPSEQLLPQFGDLSNVKDYKAINNPYKIMGIDNGSPWGVAFSSAGLLGLFITYAYLATKIS